MDPYCQYVLVLVCFGFVDSVERGFVYCPAYPCTCESKDGGLIINCRHLYLSALPKLLSFEGRIKELSLRYNSIKNLPANGFHNLHVEKLDLLDNVVTFIHNDAFSGLEDSLKWLSVQLYAMDGIPTIPLSRLRRLRTLVIVGCKQQELRADLFFNLTMLEELHLTGCRITDIHPGTFNPLSNLITLVLAKNGLRFQNIAEINVLDKLIYLDISFNDIQLLENLAFFQLSKLRSLNLGSNKLRYIAKQAFYNLDFSLEELIVCENEIKEQHLNSLAELKVLRKLDMSFNKISNLSGEFFISLRYLSSLNIAYNNLKVIDRGSFRALSSVLELDMRSNPVQLIENGAFSELVMLDQLNINNTKLGGTLRFQTFDGLSASLTYLDVSNSSVVSSDIQAFSRLSNLTNLDLSYNRINDLDIKILVELDKLKYANFSHNNISSFPKKRMSMFSSSLKVLDLSWNKIQTIQNCSFFLFKELNNFRLEGNPLTCNCSLSWLYRWLLITQSNHYQENYKWTCSAPVTLKDYYFSELDFSDFKCSNSPSHEDRCENVDNTTRTSQTATEASILLSQVTPVCGPICVNISRTQFGTVYVQWLVGDTAHISGFNLTIKRHNDSSEMQSAIVSGDTFNYTFLLNDTIKLDICVVALNQELLPLAQKCQIIPTFASSQDEESAKKQLHNLIQNSFLPLMFMYISGSISLAFIVACIAVCIRRKRKTPRRVKPLGVAYPAWLDHRTSVSSSSMTHDPHFLNTLFVDNVSTLASRNASRQSTAFSDRLGLNTHNPEANLPVDFPFTLSSRRESGMENRGPTCDTTAQLPPEIMTGRSEVGDNFFFHF